ncbi:MAG: hypothetical protein NC420_12215 [Eubacterium sp.]|nr:hypothetical protein [Eubacterium sp.]MCM1215792.1 hypothetical protein [Lachnospiraceae bacterium]MCM1304122.1 hypothetical protein [Butyrivibrio sp.]MCM1344080.1 hypothetical protein [Muribaculaceae bacterium]MCM1238355.1 hypothetical protein [Lachnospiraceae bacterium]
MKTNIKNVILALLILTLGVAAALTAYLHFFAAGDRNLSGEWSAELDMTEQAAVMAFSWLQDMEAVSVSLEDMQLYMQDLTIQVNMTLEQTARSGGTFRCHVPPESYDACRQAAYEALAAAFRELLAERLHMAGYTGRTDEEAVEALVTETFGMSTVAYLMAYGPALLPSLEELQAGYEGSGTYEAAEGILTRQFDAGGPVETEAERYIRQGSSLILSEETGSVNAGSFFDRYPVIYTLAQPDGAGKENP